MSRTLTDKTIIITGASSGIGAATAIACARAGMNTVLVARREAKLRDVAAQVETAGGKTTIVVGDVTDSNITEKILDSAETEFGGFYAVFANAGYGFEKSVLQTTEDELRQIFEVNFFAGVELLRHAGRRLVEADRPGHLLMCSSCLSKFSLAHFAAYCATKAAQNHICRAMRFELRDRSIEVASVHPVTTTTEFFETSARRSGREAEGKAVPDHTPGLFVQTPQRVAKAVVKCLHQPRSEVWTSAIVRTVAGAMTIWPWLMDMVIKHELRQKSDHT